jgi:hypothetical protein
MFRGGSPASGNAAITGATIDGAVHVGFAQTVGGASDATINWDAANALGQYNGTNAQAYRVYNTRTDASNYERGTASWQSNVLVIGSEIAGTGSARNVQITAAGVASINFNVQGANKWRVDSGGNFYATTDATNDIGATGANRPRDAYFSRTVQIGQAVAVTAGGATTGFIGISSTAALGIYCGSGAPTISAAQGSLYLRTDGSSVSTRLYVNTNGTTGWTNVTTAT